MAPCARVVSFYIPACYLRELRAMNRRVMD
jgi:hypothetical protein